MHANTVSMCRYPCSLEESIQEYRKSYGHLYCRIYSKLHPSYNVLRSFNPFNTFTTTCGLFTGTHVHEEITNARIINTVWQWNTEFKQHETLPNRETERNNVIKKQFIVKMVILFLLYC